MRNIGEKDLFQNCLNEIYVFGLKDNWKMSIRILTGVVSSRYIRLGLIIKFVRIFEIACKSLSSMFSSLLE